eukprot:TRINITY_DN15638_c0_g1_i1.p1 TRINITY_DN15638_c0_g1~~TRINITY_DN15638_c0_g1_i1.p1  ORF type:complete len:223 (-),score=32.76 TRINITY_DN15638_c0_g1_i1:64-633(-)
MRTQHSSLLVFRAPRVLKLLSLTIGLVLVLIVFIWVIQGGSGGSALDRLGEEQRRRVTHASDVLERKMSRKGETDNITPGCKWHIGGGLHVVDDRGIVCLWDAQLSNGCCDSSHTSTSPCESCNVEAGCCSDQSFCVSCCLKSLDDPSFDGCVKLCRTDSQSVQHETVYKNGEKHHCFVKDEQQRKKVQ